ncbi:MAG: long-chain fatty acid--CoA ligase [Alphaproteobacteria bacterium]|nr:long-chain fatty acid--CoA ligase [Alphaproteobacteria bacterium]
MDLSYWIERNADFRPEKTAIHFEGQDITYAAFDARIKALARALKHRLGVGRGDRVAHLGFNSPQMLDLFFACARLGAMLVPLNWRLAAPELLYIIQNCAASVVLAEEDLRPTIDTVRADIADCQFVGYDGGAGWLDYDDILAGAEGDDSNPHVTAETPFLIVYTSGTTGRPKGAVLTQSAIAWNAVNATHTYNLTSDDVILTFLPMFHVGGLNIQTTPGLHAGATIVLQAKFDPGAALQAVRDHDPSLFVSVPATMQAMIDHPDWSNTDFSNVREIVTGSTNVPLPLIRAYLERGIKVGQMYGSSETAPIAIVLLADDGERKLGSTGKPAIHCEIRIVDADGNDLPDGEPGEILVRGPNVLFEYWGNEAATEEALRDGWYHSGDIGYRDEDGFYFIVDRKKDMIISGSENIYPAELEAVLAECPDIAESAVVARPDDKWGEVAVAVVVRGEGVSLDREQVMGLYENTLARYKHPRDVVFVDALPRNAMGKILKFEIRAMVKE